MSAAPASVDVAEHRRCDGLSRYPAEVESLLGVLRSRRRPCRTGSSATASYAERRGLRHRAADRRGAGRWRATRRGRAARRAGVRDGDRVILSLSDPHDFLVAFFGTLIAGASAVPLPTVAEAGAPRSFAARVRAVCADCASRAGDRRARRALRAGGRRAAGRLAVREPRDPAGRGAAPDVELGDRARRAAGLHPVHLGQHRRAQGRRRHARQHHRQLPAPSATRPATRAPTAWCRGCRCTTTWD